MFDFLPDVLRLSFFPGLLTWAGLAPFILRLFIGYASIKEGLAIRKTNNLKFKIVGLSEIIFGVLIFIGFMTQLAVIGLAITSISILFFQKRIRPLTAVEKHYRLLHIAILLALLFLGPGFFAIDYPL